MLQDLPYWCPPESVAPIRAAISEAGYGEISLYADGPDVLSVSAVSSRTKIRYVVRCKALRDWADVLQSLDRQQRRDLLRGRTGETDGME